MAGIGKAAMILVAFMIATFAIVSIFAISQKDQSTDAYYQDLNNTANGTIAMGKSVTNSIIGTISPMVLVVAILFLAAVFGIFKSKGR